MWFSWGRLGGGALPCGPKAAQANSRPEYGTLPPQATGRHRSQSKWAGIGAARWSYRSSSWSGGSQYEPQTRGLSSGSLVPVIDKGAFGPAAVNVSRSRVANGTIVTGSGDIRTVGGLTVSGDRVWLPPLFRLGSQPKSDTLHNKRAMPWQSAPNARSRLWLLCASLAGARSRRPAGRLFTNLFGPAQSLALSCQFDASANLL